MENSNKEDFNNLKIDFKYSWIYDQTWRKIGEKSFKEIEIPPVEDVKKYLKEVEELWRKDESRVLAELSKVTGIRWKVESIFCYVVGRCFPYPAFSHPLTISVYKKKDEFIDVLIHELIHHLLFENMQGFYIDKKYSEESRKTKIHIPIHAAHKHIYLTLFNKKRLVREIRKMDAVVDYKRAWDIVNKEGHENILKEIKADIK